jgi:Ca2+-binding RTX toxin-like protein
MSTISLTGDFGFSAKRLAGLATGTKVDASSASFVQDNWAGDGGGSNPYPFQVVQSPGAIIIGGRIIGEVDQTTDWRIVYDHGNSAGVRIEDSPNATIRDWRISNTWDAVRVSWNSQNFLIEDVWVTNARDDAVENDRLLTGTIRDSLFDGVFGGVSVDPSSSSPVDGHNETVTLDGVLMRLQPSLYLGEMTHESFIKTDSATNGAVTPHLRFINNVIAIEDVNHHSYRSLRDAWSHAVESSGNYYLNLSDTPLPAGYPMPPSGWTVLQGQAARDYWQNARAEWVGRHSDGAPTFSGANFTGTSLGENIVGNALNNMIDAKGGNDTINGGVGADNMFGGVGNDLYYVDNALDKVTEAVGGGSDRVLASISYALAAGQSVEILATTNAAGIGAINLTGNAFNNLIQGNAGVNILNGGGGIDTMVGFGGSDQYSVDVAGDIVTEAAGGGIADRVLASVSYALGAGQEIEILTTTNSTGLGAINLSGNAFSQTIQGNAGVNVLNGAGGLDTLVGFGGNDQYYVDVAGDIVIEAVGGGSDRVFASVSYALGAGQEIEILSTTNTAGLGAINLTGNAFNNTVAGNNGNNVINGSLGNDVLWGYSGSDVFVFNTALNAATNHDVITDFNVAADTIHLENAIFTLLTASGTLAAGLFGVFGAQDASDVILYDQANGNLYYDSNGLVAGGQTLFADVTNGLALTNLDFFVT